MRIIWLDALRHGDFDCFMVAGRYTLLDNSAQEALIPVGEELDGGLEFEPASDDEDESAVADLPDGFEEALLMRRECIELSFRTDRLPESWTLGWTPPGQVRVHLLDATAWRGHGQPVRMEVSLPANLEVLPFLLDVDWTAAGESNRAGWIVNIGPEAVLPPPSELTGLSSDVLLAILASTRPLREAIENALRAKSTRKKPGGDELDPLKRFDDSGLLIQRVRRASAALWGIARRLSARCSSLDALEWRLAGTLGPEHVARKLADAASPLYATLDEAQKRRLQVLVRMGGRGMMGQGMMGQRMMGPGGAMMPGGSDDDDDNQDNR